MFRTIATSSRGRRLFSLGLLTLIATAVITTDAAEARRRHHATRHHARVSSYSPPFSSIVVDANSGSVLQSTNSDALRHPASLTKIMTLYLLFEKLQAGKIKLDTEIKVSEHASEQAPTKLGLRPGQTIEVEDAIKGLVTRSANDAAVTIAEALGGSEEDFAKQMTRKARALGMSKTVYRNASGLPDDEQVTSARDQSILGRSIQERFPQYYRYFSTDEFRFRGTVIRNHNHLLGRVEGVDGIKTGYTRASGFNLVTSMRRGNRHLVAVVLGGRSGSSRDAIMRNLLAENIDQASTKRTVADISERNAAQASDAKVAAADAASSDLSEPKAVGEKTFSERLAAALEPRKTVEVASADDGSEATAPTSVRDSAPQRTAAVQTEPVQRPAPLTNGVINSQPLALLPGSSEPMQPKRVKTVVVKAAPIKVASAGPAQPAAAPAPVSMAPSTDRTMTDRNMSDRAEPSREPAAAPKMDSAQQAAGYGTGKGILGVLPARASGSSTAMAYADAPPSRTASPIAIPQTTGTVAAPVAAPVQAAVAQPAPQPNKPQLKAGTWIVQVGALESEAEANKRLGEARGAANALLGKAMQFTEEVDRGDRRLYRARFANLDRDQAEAACKTLKKSDISCFAIKN